ncbi:MAG: hypothetical protein KatS3mg090_0033 [Patescibacteria group bacterium]|nr:MAG: hypothetical protein KatS3mg090_0033 [Patescibacteria group bacterium]
MHGKAVASAFFVFSYQKAVAQPADLGIQAGGQKGRGLGGRNFCAPAMSAEGGLGVGSGSSLRQQGSKARSERGEPLGGIAAQRAAISQRRGFAGRRF